MDASADIIPGRGTVMIILFIMVIHFLGAVCAMYCIFHNDPFLAAYLVVSLTISAISGHLRAWEGGQDG